MNDKRLDIDVENAKIIGNLQHALNKFDEQYETPNLYKTRRDDYAELDNEICKLIITKEFINDILEFSINYKTEITYINNGLDITFRIIWFISGNQLELKINNKEIV